MRRAGAVSPMSPCRTAEDALAFVQAHGVVLVSAKGDAPGQLAQVREEHTPSGRHVTTDVPFPQWVPPGMAELAGTVDEAEALACFAAWLGPAGRPR
jgi:hypothetical protein